MGEKKTTNKSGSLATGIAIAVLPFVKPVVEAVVDRACKTIADRKEYVSVPELYSKSYPLTVEQANDVLSEHGLKSKIVKASLKDADPKYRNCFVGQVISTQPKAKHKVEPGTSILLKCITQEVIDESQRLYENSEKQKAEAKARRADQIEQSKTTLIGVTDKVKELPKRRRNKKEGENDEQASSQQA